MNKVLILGKHEHGIAPFIGAFDEGIDHELELDQIARLRGKGYTTITQCNGVKNLIETLRSLAASGGLIDVLDICDHGIPGGILIGDQILFHHDGKTLLTGLDVAPQLAPFLAESAQLRLLGCKTALQAEGRGLLLSVGQLLGGHRVVLGTLERVFAKDFSEDQGFLLELELLYSSLAALDSVAPSATQRQSNLIAIADILDPKSSR